MLCLCLFNMIMNIVVKLLSGEVNDIEYALLLFTGKNVPSVFHSCL